MTSAPTERLPDALGAEMKRACLQGSSGASNRVLERMEPALLSKLSRRLLRPVQPEAQLEAYGVTA
jgi:hypothetical protein